jgi:hypothetical protein
MSPISGHGPGGPLAPLRIVAPHDGPDAAPSNGHIASTSDQDSERPARPDAPNGESERRNESRFLSPSLPSSSHEAPARPRRSSCDSATSTPSSDEGHRGSILFKYELHYKKLLMRQVVKMLFHEQQRA